MPSVGILVLDKLLSTGYLFFLLPKREPKGGEQIYYFFCLSGTLNYESLTRAVIYTYTYVINNSYSFRYIRLDQPINSHQFKLESQLLVPGFYFITIKCFIYFITVKYLLPQSEEVRPVVR